MNCEQCQELIPLEVIGALDGSERDALREHLADGCPVCQGKLAEAEAVAGHLTLALPQADVPQSVRQRLLSRVQEESHGSQTSLSHDTSLPSSQPQPGSFAQWRIAATIAIAACLALAVTAAIVMGSLQRQSAQLQQLSDELMQRDRQLQAMQAQLDFATRTLELVRSPAAKVAVLEGAEPQQEAAGQLWWDPQARRVHFYARHMKPAPQGQTYQLWLVTEDEQPVSVGVFDVDHNGWAELLVVLPGQIGPVALAAVTDEPAGGSPGPTGSFQLIGTMQ